MASFFKSWHRPARHYRAKKQPLSDTWWPRVSKHKAAGSGFIEIVFVDVEGKEIKFVIDGKQAANFRRQLLEAMPAAETSVSEMPH